MTETNNIKNIPIPFKENLDFAECEKVTIVNMVNDIKKKKEMLLADQHDVELILCVMEEFNDVVLPTHLNLTQGPQKFEKFRECLAGPIRDDWDTAREGQPETNAGFRVTMSTFIESFLDENLLEEQKLYMQRG